jgi:D-glycero-D-manno-heptose 1,7-bisphosphate phosphatase
MKKQVLFLDLDGTIIETASGETFPKHIGDMKFKDGILESLKKFVLENDDSIYIFIVTNQGGIQMGYVDENAFREKLRFVCKCIYSYLQHYIDGHCITVDSKYCPSIKENENRKPNTGMLTFLLEKHKLNVEQDAMLMVGDVYMQNEKIYDTNRETAENFGIDYKDVKDFIANPV